MKLFITYLVILKCLYSKLLGVIQLNRHGARTPKEYPEITKNLFYSSSDAHLTLNGFNQHNLLGHWVKERYNKEYSLLSKEYKKEENLFIASPITRTIFSASSFIEGMYPGVIINPIWENNSNLRSIDLPPIKDFNISNNISVDLIVKDKQNDTLFHASKCRIEKNGKKLSELLIKEKVLNITDQEKNETLDDIKNKVPQLFEASEIVDMETFCGFFFPINYHYDNLYKLKKESFEVLRKIQINKMYSKRMNESNISKLIISPFYDLMRGFLENFVDYNNKLKYVLFSGHDTNLMDFISSLFDKKYLLNLFKTDDESYYFIMPPFASSLIFELHALGKTNLKSQKFIRIVYNGKIIRDGYRIELNYDNQLEGIPYENFINFLNQTIDLGYSKLLCGNGDDDENSKSKSKSSEIDIISKSFISEYEIINNNY